MRFGSVKFRLIFWNTATVMALFLPLLLVIYLAVNALLISSIDKKLLARAERCADRIRDSFAMTNGRSVPPKNVERKRINMHEVGDLKVFLPPPILFDGEGRPVDPFYGPDLPRLRPLNRGKMLESLSNGRDPVFFFDEVNSYTLRVVYLPIRLDDGRTCAVQALLPASELEELKSLLTRILLAMIPIVLVLSGLTGYALTGSVLKPVRRIAETVSEINASGISRRLESSGSDEFSSLVVTINGMLDRLEEAFKALRLAFERERQFTSDASHELRTPLTVIKASASLALRSERDASYYRRTIEDVDKASDSMLSILESLLILARSDGGALRLSMERIDVGEFLDSIVSMKFPKKGGRTISFSVSEEGLAFMGDAGFVRRFFVNLIDNAIRYTGEDGRITVSACREDGMVRLSVSDDGCGIGPEHIPHLTERFYRVDKSRAREDGGVGLGLAICKSIVDMHSGRMEISSEPGRGTVVSALFAAL